MSQPPTVQAGRRRRAARHAGEASLIAREAEVLEAARHPGVVELIGVDGSGALPALVTLQVAGPTLGAEPPVSVEEVAGVLAAVASTLADLHSLGVVHGALAPDHVLLSPGGRPVLCGFGHGGRIGQAPVAPPALPPGFSDPARPPGGPLHPPTDVFGLGALTQWLVQRCPAGGGGRPLLRLRALAARATAADPDRRPTARELASAIADAVPGSRLPAAGGDAVNAPGPGAGPRRRRRRATTPRRAVVIAFGLGVAAVVVLAGLRVVRPAVQPLGTWDRQPAARPPETRPPATSLPSTAATQLGRAERRGCPAVTAPLAADTDGDGCAEELRWADGVLETVAPASDHGGGGSARWRVGGPGDQLATGDWSCAGSPTLALLRPATGEVFVFDGWAMPGRDQVADLAGRVEGGFAMRAAELDGDPCPDLVVDRRHGPPATVAVRTDR